MSLDSTELIDFLYAASMPHALGTSNAKSTPDGSTTITFRRGDWYFHDNFFGGQPYGGRAVIYYKGRPVWIMVYYGQIHDTDIEAGAVHDFLRLALQHAPRKKPYRGPDQFMKGVLEYRNRVDGGVTSYSGRETIAENGKEIYWATYCGGIVDQELGVGF